VFDGDRAVTGAGDRYWRDFETKAVCVNFSKKTLFWVIILISLAGAFHFFDQEKESEKQLIAASFRLLPFNVADVSEFWINNLADHREIRAVRDGDDWKLVRPLVAKGDKEAIEKYLRIIVTARKDAILFSQPTPEKLKELGLDNPKIEVGLATQLFFCKIEQALIFLSGEELHAHHRTG
jgi:hypothetical protein